MQLQTRCIVGNCTARRDPSENNRNVRIDTAQINVSVFEEVPETDLGTALGRDDV